jgi:hypothetical protein
VTYIASPAKFFFQRTSRDDVFEAMHHRVIYNGGEDHPAWEGPFEAGDLLLAVSVSDGLLYRAQVLREQTSEDLLREEVLVHFLDIGHDQWVALRDVYQMPAEIMSHPPLVSTDDVLTPAPSYHIATLQVDECGIHGLYPNAPDGRWTEKSCQVFNDLIRGYMCKMEVTSVSEIMASPSR